MAWLGYTSARPSVSSVTLRQLLPSFPHSSSLPWMIFQVLPPTEANINKRMSSHIQKKTKTGSHSPPLNSISHKAVGLQGWIWTASKPWATSSPLTLAWSWDYYDWPAEGSRIWRVDRSVVLDSVRLLLPVAFASVWTSNFRLWKFFTFFSYLYWAALQF